MNRYGFFIIVLLAVVALVAVGFLAFDAGREVAAGPQSVSAVIASHNAGREAAGGGGNPMLWALLLIGGALAMGFLFWRGGDLVRQVRLTFKRKARRQTPAGEVPTVPRLPVVREVPNDYPRLPAGHGSEGHEY